MIRAVVGNEDIIPTSTREEDVTYELNVYPNPTTGFLNIDMENVPANSLCRIFDQLGNQVKTLDLQHQINLEELPQGMYFLNVEDDNGISYAKTKFVIIK